MPNLIALPWWAATFFLGLSEAAEVAAITGAFGTVSSLIAAWFGYRSLKLQRASRRIEVHEDVGPFVGQPDPGIDRQMEGEDTSVVGLIPPDLGGPRPRRGGSPGKGPDRA